MKIRINTGDYREYVEFPIMGITYQIDEDNVPVDIAIYGDEDTLDSICEYARIGCCMQPLEDYPGALEYHKQMCYKGAQYECLIARLPEFKVLEARYCNYK